MNLGKIEKNYSTRKIQILELNSLAITNDYLNNLIVSFHKCDYAYLEEIYLEENNNLDAELLA